MRLPMRTNEAALYYSYIVMGFAGFAPWRCFVAALDYFEDIYPEKDAAKWMTVAYWAPSSFVLLVLAWIPTHRWQGNAITVCFVTSTSVLSLIPLMDFLFIHGKEASNSTLYVSLFLVTILGSATAVLDTCLLGSSMNLPVQYPQAYATGLSFSALFVYLLRLLTKGVFSGVQNGLKYGAYVFFFLCALSCIAALFIYITIVQPHPLLEKCNAEEIKGLEADSLDDQEALIVVHRSADDHVTCGRTAFLIKAPAIMISVTTIANVFVNPGIIVDAQWKPLGDWFELLLLMVFAVSELLGRVVIAKHTMCSEGKVFTLTIVRLLIMVSSVLVLEYLPGPIFMMLIVAMTGLSYGYHTLSCYYLAQVAMKGTRESFTGGSVLLIAESVGAFIGSLLTLARTGI